MGSVWGLALPLLFFCWDADVFGNSAGLGTSSPVFLVTNTTEVPALPQGVRIKTEGAFQSTDLAEYSTVSHASLETQFLSAKAISKTFIPTSTISESPNTSPVTETTETQTTYTAAVTLESQTTSPAEETRKTQKTYPAEETREPQPTYTAAATLKSQATFSVIETRKTQTTPLEAETRLAQDTSLETEAGKLQTTTSVAETRLPQTTFSQTRVLRKIITSNFVAVLTTPMETSATSGNLRRTGVSLVETGIGPGPTDVTFSTICTDDSSEEANRVTIGFLTLANTSKEAESLSSESSSSSESSVQVIFSPQMRGPDTETPAKDLFAYGITHIEFGNCSITDIETAAIISGTSDTDQSSAGGMALSTSKTSAMSHSTEAMSHISQTTKSATLETTLPISSTIESKPTAAKKTTPSTTLVTVTRNPLEETSALSIEKQSQTELLRTASMDAGSTVDNVISFAHSSALVNSPPALTTTKYSIPSERVTTDGITNRPFFISGNPFPFFYLTTTRLNKKTSITLAQTTASPKTLMKFSTSIPTTLWIRQTTKATPGGDKGFLLVHLTVASPEDLTEPRVTERLMEQLHCELRNRMPLTQVTLLRVRRG
uniref:mucin-20 n=1 Tax=Jaculus jaculus TaxID=51337 RepID=UPI001E1B50EB|nr:mucin-20 [Jaculus jaculus]